MKRVTSVKTNRNTVKHSSGWDGAIADTADRLSFAQERVDTLRDILASFKEMKAKGVRWPSASATQN